jgi:hypothetical protein
LSKLDIRNIKSYNAEIAIYKLDQMHLFLQDLYNNHIVKYENIILLQNNESKRNDILFSQEYKRFISEQELIKNNIQHIYQYLKYLEEINS